MQEQRLFRSGLRADTRSPLPMHHAPRPLSQLTFIQTPQTNMRSSRTASLNAFLAKMSRDDAKAHREMGHASAPKGAHACKEISNHSKIAAGREPLSR